MCTYIVKCTYVSMCIDGEIYKSIHTHGYVYIIVYNSLL
jgi:hypothetical protein